MKYFSPPLILISILLSTPSIYAASILVETEGADTPLFSAENIRLVNQLQKKGVQVEATEQLKIVLRVDKVFKFPTSTQLTNPPDNTLLEIAKLLMSYGSRQVTVSGHTDNVGSDAAKLKRSRDQANTIAAYLWSQGIPLKNLVVLGCGDTKPVASNMTPEGSAANRRIEIEIH